MSERLYLNPDDACRLLEAATQASTFLDDLAERRRVVLSAIGEIVGADAGHWTWGRGNPVTSTIAPVAIIDFGYSDQQRAEMVSHYLSAETMATFQLHVEPRLDHRRQLTVTRRDVYPDEAWGTTARLVEHVARLGLDSWLHAVRYWTEDTWSALHLMRRIGAEEFDAREAALVDVALAGVSWLNVQTAESLPAEAFVGLTPRQRTVMLHLLDGMSRKEIATRLAISADTVGDHLKALYHHFGVTSAGELSARFLKSS
jgi:DNA-binding CsgD family transcriptional regulator